MAEIWHSVVQSETNAKYYYDPTTIKQNGAIVNYWELVNYQKRLVVKELTIASSKTEVMANCENNTYRNLQIIDYSEENGLGNIVHLDLRGSTSWQPVLRESVSWFMQEQVCRSQSKK